MKLPLRILHLEDDPNDVLLIREAIIAHGIDAEIVDAATRAEFVDALEKETYDLVLADYTLPTFDGLSALIIVREKFPDLPFIFVTGAMGEEQAVETLKKGATDYVLKHNLTRLVPSIMRALREAEERIERKKAQDALRESERRLREAQEMARLGYWRWDVRTGAVEWSEEVFKIFHLDPNKFTPRIDSILALSPWPEDHERDKELIRRAMENHEKGVYEQRFLRPDKSIGYYHSTFQGGYDDGGNLIFIVGTVLDITERKRAEDALRESEERFRMLVESAPEAIFVQSEGCFVYLNPAMVSLLGALTPEELLGKEIKQRIAPEYHEAVLERIRVQRETGKPAPLMEQEYLRLDGSRVSVETTAVTVSFQDRDAHLVFVRDITERKRSEEKLRYLAYYDSLTGLPNRNLFLENIDQEIAEAKDSSNSLAIVITDINKFKSIYDLYGSAVGDRVLKEVAERLSAAIRKGDFAAHLGNDEFGIACIGLTDTDDIIMLDKIIKEVSYPLNIHGDEIILTFSTGISLYPHDGENASELLKAAGLALSTAKKEGRKTCQFYTKEMNVEASEKMLLEKQLMKAIIDKEFILYYQPYWDITTKKMVGMEALVRWQSKDKGLVPPGKFIPVLEDTGMIIEVGEWILREAMRQVKEWQNNGYPVVPVSVNMSLVQFRQKDLTAMVKRIMKDRGYYPSLLTLEITESAFMQDIEFTKSVLTAMKEIGCSVSIDDFGTGYSSLAYLKRLPVDNLKIDISFIREMVKDPDSASIVVAIINMAHTLNLKTIAEGVETEEQWNFLRLLRCDMGQGFYLSKPLPAEDVEKLFIH
jgi:diguanylate cyclase (GGDEF)-like protein/PAS domain S-box-containing protein